MIKALAVSCNGFFFSTFDQEVLLGVVELALRAGYTLVEGEAPHVAPDPLIHGDGIKIRPIGASSITEIIAGVVDCQLAFAVNEPITMKKAGVELNRKVLADIALNDAAGFSALVAQAKGALPQLQTS